MYLIYLKYIVFLFFIFIVTFLVVLNNLYAAAFEDDEACLMCHKYVRMARITEEGVFRSYYVPPDTFSKTVHRNVPCRDCHSYIKQLPHSKVDEGVRCDQKCHSKKNPATGKPFSHKAIYELYSQSVHAREKSATGLDSDKPYCITCHTNPVYNPNEKEPPKEILDRCELCHEKRDFVKQWYFHTSRRVLDIKRTGQEIVQVCIRCHADEELIKRHANSADREGRELGKKFTIAATSYQNSFHGKVTRYGLSGAATCLDCHADSTKYYESVHKILPSRNPDSPVSQGKRVKTCQRCHTNADENYAFVDPHPSFDKESNPILYKAEYIYSVVSEVIVAALLGLALFETIGRRRDGVAWRIQKGSSWLRPSRRGRKRSL
jgi:hypothetical protein